MHIANVVVGSRSGAMARVATDAVPSIVKELPLWKRFNVENGSKWTDVSAFMAEVLSDHYGEMAERGLTADSLGPEDHKMQELHSKLLVWLLHRVGKLGEAIGRANQDATVVEIVPGLGLKGIRVSFRPIPTGMVAANDNNGRPTLH